MNKTLAFRFRKTLEFVNKFVSKDQQVLDLGAENELASFLRTKGYTVQNAYGFDFDLESNQIKEYNTDVLTAFEVLEHLVSPLQVLQKTSAKKLIVTVPLKLWFAKAYQNVNDPYDQHYHEFESWQLDMLLVKADWKIIAREKWVPPFVPGGVRSILRAFTPRFYAVYAERI